MSTSSAPTKETRPPPAAGISWRDQTLASIAPPPLPLIVFFGLFIMLMYLTSYRDYKEKVERSKMTLRFFLILLPLIVTFIMNLMSLHRRLWRYASGVPRNVCDAVADEGSPPWGLMLFVVLVLVMVHYQSSFHSAWFLF